MPVTPTYPGVYIEEIPSGVHTITPVGTSITAFVGYTATGPVNKAQRITNYGDFERAFGGLNRDSDVSYAVQQFFLNGGSDAYVVRVARNVATAGVGLRYDTGGSIGLNVTAANPGAWGNNLRLDVDYATSNPDSSFNLRVTRLGLQDGVLVPLESEQYRNLSMNKSSALYVEKVVNAGSQLISVGVPAAALSGVTDRGWTQSGNLADLGTTAATTLAPADTTITGVIDGYENFMLTINPAGMDLTNVLARITTAINNAGVGTAGGATARLVPSLVNALGGTTGTQSYLRLTSSQRDAANDKQKAEVSSVEITSAPAKLKLGLPNGGREKEGASGRRPWPSGTLSQNQADQLDSKLSDLSVDPRIQVRIVDNATSPATELLAWQTVNLSGDPTVRALPATLQAAIRAIPNAPAEAAGAVVERFGPFMRSAAGGTRPNASIQFQDATAPPAGLTGAASTLRLTGGTSFEGARQFSLGPGGVFGAQTAGGAGADGMPPQAGDIIGSRAPKTGMYALLDTDLFNLLVIPQVSTFGDAAAKNVLDAAVALCEERRAFVIVDPPTSKNRTSIGPWASSFDTKNGAVYYPLIRAADPLEDFRIRPMAPSGAIAGVYARTDASRGVWKAPAGIEAGVRGAFELSETLTDEENGQLNPLGVNVIRSFPVYGTILWGARTLKGDDRKASEWKYIPIRRLALMIEESLFRGTKWVVFEPNDEPLWAQIRLNVGAFMHNLFRQGAFQGKSSREAYFVKCDAETTTQNDRDLGRVNIVVGFAPLKPAEFVIIQIQQIAGQIET